MLPLVTIGSFMYITASVQLILTLDYWTYDKCRCDDNEKGDKLSS